MRCAFGGLGLDSLPDRISKPFCTICADGGRRGTMANASPRHTAGFKASAVELHKAAGLDAVYAEIAREPGCGAGSPSHWVKTAGGAFPLRAHRDLLQQASDSLGAGLAQPGGARGEARRRRPLEGGIEPGVVTKTGRIRCLDDPLDHFPRDEGARVDAQCHTELQELVSPHLALPVEHVPESLLVDTDSTT